MSRTLAPGEDSEGIESVPDDEIEELGDEAIIAQQSQAHLPQKRANVQEELRSIVIAEDPIPTSSRRPVPYRAEAPEATLVMRDRDRRELEAMRRKVIEEKQRRDAGRGITPFVWAALAIGAFAAGGLVTLLIVRGSATAAPEAVVEPRPAREPRARSTEVRGTTVRAEPATPQVKLEELPLEKPAR